MERINDIFGFAFLNGVMCMVSVDAMLDLHNGMRTRCIVATLPETIDDPAEYCTIHDAEIIP